MDTVEQINGYFYKGYWNLKPAELYTLIFIDVASQHLEVEAGAISAILLGQPWIPTRVKPGGTVKGTSVVSILNRKIFPNVRLPRGVTLPVLVGKKISELRWAKSNQVGAIIGRSNGLCYVLLHCLHRKIIQVIDIDLFFCTESTSITLGHQI